MNQTYRVRDVPRWQDRWRLRCKYLSWALFMLVAVVLSVPMLLVLGVFFPEEVQAGIENVNAVVDKRWRDACEEMRRLGAKPLTPP